MPDEPVPSRDLIESAPTGRSRCRACQRAIAKGSPRFAESAPNPMTEGETRHYYHPSCAADRRPERVLGLLAASTEPIARAQELRAAAELAVAHPRLVRLGRVERASSGRSTCRHCRRTIDKGALRVALQPIEDGRLASWGYLHASCVRGYVGVRPNVERLRRTTEGLDETTWAEVDAALEVEVPAAAKPEAEAEASEAARPEAGSGE